MTTFIWVILCYLTIEAIAKIICLAAGYMPPRNKGATAIDIILAGGIIIWGAILLRGA